MQPSVANILGLRDCLTHWLGVPNIVSDWNLSQQALGKLVSYENLSQSHGFKRRDFGVY